MISFFRRALSSWIVLGLLALIMIAFIITGVSTPGSLGGSGGGATVAKAGSIKIGETELVRRVQNQLDGVRREQPTVDRKLFVAEGGFEGVTNALISARALESWGAKQGYAISKLLIDAQIAQNPAFRGVTGQFDEAAMRNMLAQARVSEKDMRSDIASDLLRGQILAPVAAGARVPLALAQPYSAMLLESRAGSVGIIPFVAVADPRAPSEADIAAAYKADIATYTRPEARVLRYAMFGPAQVADAAKPTDADVAEYYQQNASSYAARDSRTLSQVIAPNEAVARTIAAAAKAGTPLAAAGAKAGLEASTLKDQARDDYSGASSAAIAAQAFTAAKGAVIGPVKGAFGWYVVKVDDLTGTPARSLEQVRPEIVAKLSVQKAQDALSELGGKIEDAIADGASFAEVAANHKLTVVETPPLLANGQPIAPTAWKAPPELAPLLKAGFAAAPEDRPSVETVAKDQQYALLSVAKVVPPTPLQLAQVHDAVARNIIVKRAAARAQALGKQVVAAVDRGVPLAKALADTGVKLPPVKPAKARQIDLARASQSGAQVPAAVQALFTLQKGKAKLSQGPEGVLFVTVLESVTPGDVKTVPGLVHTTRQELSRSYTPELGEQFQRAIEKDVDVKRYPEAIAAAKRQFVGGQ